MAQKTVVQLVDDLDGKELNGEGETVVFALDGITYEIDLSKKNAEKLRSDFGKYVDVARKVAGSRTPRRGRKAGAGPDAAAVKAWADTQGLEYPSRGRLPKTLLEAFENRSK